MAEFRVGVAGIVRDEAPYLLEWIAWNRMIGVEHFVIADHGSTDGTSELLDAFARAGIVTRIPVDGDAVGPQAAAYERIMVEHGHRFEWLGFLDADEFVVLDPGLDMPGLLASLPDDAGGLALNWACYGSSWQPVPDRDTTPFPVVERFAWRGTRDFDTNHHVKSFVRPGASFAAGAGAVHAPRLPAGLHYVAPDGTENPVPADGLRGKSEEVRWGKARINHYLVKSRWEFENRKLVRGDAAFGGRRSASYFEYHDANAQFDPVPPDAVLRLRSRMRQLAIVLSSHGYTPGVARAVELPEGVLTAERARLHYAVETGSVCLATGRRYVEGWSFNDGGQQPMASMDLTFGHPSRPVRPDVVVHFPRPDIQTRHPRAPLMSGFRLYLPSTPIGPDDALPVYDDGQRIELLPASLFTPVRYLPFPEDLDEVEGPGAKKGKWRSTR